MSEAEGVALEDHQIDGDGGGDALHPELARASRRRSSSVRVEAHDTTLAIRGS